MLLRSRTLHRLYPEQTWLDNLDHSVHREKDTFDVQKILRPRNTAHKLRQLQAAESESYSTRFTNMITGWFKHAA